MTIPLSKFEITEYVAAFIKDYARIIDEWSQIINSALMFAYLEKESASDTVHQILLKGLHDSLPIQILSLWGNKKDTHPRCLNKIEERQKNPDPLRKMLFKKIENWRDIRNSIAHQDSEKTIEPQTTKELLHLCILLGFYIEALSLKYKDLLEEKYQGRALDFMSNINHHISDVSVVLGRHDDMVKSINVLLTKPLVCVDKEAYIEIADKTGKYRNDYRVIVNHGPAIKKFYFEQKNIVKDTIT